MRTIIIIMLLLWVLKGLHAGAYESLLQVLKCTWPCGDVLLFHLWQLSAVHVVNNKTIKHW